MISIIDQLQQAWHTNNRINLFLIDRISDEGMSCTLSKRGGRNVVRQFAHMHNARIWHLEDRASELSKGLYTYQTKEEPGKSRLKRDLMESAERIATFLKDCAEGKAKRRAFRKGVVSTAGYFIAHESHHRGIILLTLKQCGHAIDQQSRYAIWDWDKI